MSQISNRYDHREVEDRIYQWWEGRGYFKAHDQSTKPPFSIILPPPNVTGFLHLGHALNHAIQDCLIRWKRMSGFNTLWLPGSDHAGIATQVVVEKELRKSRLTRRGLGREKFLEKVWDWKNQYGNRIYNQMRRLGDSCDWSRARFTLDDNVTKAVRRVFVLLYKKNLIYRGQRLVNWSGPLETAISDLEVEHKEIKGSLWHIRYGLEDGSGYLVVGTTRPETLLGDVAVCVHPEDSRYNHLVGRSVVLPLIGRKIPIIQDTYVDKEFGSGVVKITPAHDFNDYKIGKTHKLPVINILTQQCRLNENAGPYRGLSIQEARQRVLEDLRSRDLIEKEEVHQLSVGHCSRSGAVVEPFLSEQWFVRMEQLSVPAKRVVESGTIKIEPESWTRVYLHWMSIIEDWCISRQLWWGHRIPAWYCLDCQHITVSEVDAVECEACHSRNIHQEEDVLDTWFSSALWPFSTMDWPQEAESLKTFYPTNILVTGYDILFFWVARMVVMGLEFMRDVPFREIYLNGMVRDSQGRKMSKSLNNSVDPIDLVDKYGADALRFSLLAHTYPGKDYKFSEPRTEGYRNFMNKIWNATRFAMGHLSDFSLKEVAIPNKLYLSVFDQWIVKKLGEVETAVEEAMEQGRFSDAAGALYSFVWYEFCDWYIEFSKPVLGGSDQKERGATQVVMAQVLNRIMRLLHPFVPFISEELYQKLPIRNQACIVDEYPTTRSDREFLALASEGAAMEVDFVKEVILAIRNIRGENRISPAQKINARINPIDAEAQKILGNNRNAIISMSRLGNLEIGPESSLAKCAVTLVVMGVHQVKVVVPLEGLVDIEEEIRRIEKTIDKLTKEERVLSARLNNESFIKNATEEVVEADRISLEKMRNQADLLREALLRLRV